MLRIRKTGKVLLAAVLLSTAFCLSGQKSESAASRELSGVSMPATVKVAGRKLELNGMGVGTKLGFIKVYVIGLYLETRTENARTAVEANEAKRIELTMLRDVTREQFVSAVEEGISDNSGGEMPFLRERLNKLEGALSALKEGSALEFTYIPSVGTVVRGQDREMTILGKDFAEAMFSIWLGPKPKSKSLQRELLGG